MQKAFRERILLLVAALVVIGAGIGMRDPWPADEPRFALVAKEMVETGDWLIPHRAGHIYADKPPVFFWFIAAVYALTGSLAFAFRVPALVGSIIALLLVHDLALRLFGRRAAAYAAGALLVCLQFTIQARSGQIDGFLVVWTTFGFYALVRFLLLGGSYAWWYAAFAAMGFGIITKGVGFLPLLMLIPWALFRRRSTMPRTSIGALHAAGAVVMLLLAVSVWLVPMLLRVENSATPELVAYRDNILLKQTGERYAKAWHHHKWPGYFFVEVIPWAWFPLSLALVWIVPAWWRRLRKRDARFVLLLGWVLMVLLFFTLSAGKRGLYILPALPAAAVAAAPWLPLLARRRGFARSCRIAAIAFAAIPGLGAIALLVQPSLVARELQRADPSRIALGLAVACVLGIIVQLRFRTRPHVALALTLAAAWIAGGLLIEPAIDADRSGRGFITSVVGKLPPGAELGILGWREQFALHAGMPVTTFGYARTDVLDEARDGIRWSQGANRFLLVPEAALPCFSRPGLVPLERETSRMWYLAAPGTAAPQCR